MLGNSKFWRIAAVSLSGSAFALAPALAGACGFNGCDAGYVVQQTPGYPGVLARYCDGYGGGQWPYDSCFVGRIGQGRPIAAPAPGMTFAPVPAPIAAATAVNSAPPVPVAPPIVTKY